MKIKERLRKLHQLKGLQEEPGWALPENLIEFRKQYKLSLDDLAFLTGISKAYLSQLENKQSVKCSVWIAWRLAKVMDKSIDEICFCRLPKKSAKQ